MEDLSLRHVDRPIKDDRLSRNLLIVKWVLLLFFIAIFIFFIICDYDDVDYKIRNDFLILMFILRILCLMLSLCYFYYY